MYCPQCGGGNENSAKYCVRCGLDLESYRSQWQTDGSPYGQAEGYSYQSQPVSGYTTTYASSYPPPYQMQHPGGYQAPAPPAFRPSVPSYLGWAIAVLILCFWPTGIVAVVHAARVNNRLALGDYAGAQESSRKAKRWTWITFGVGVAIQVLSFAIIFAGAAMTSTMY